MTKKEELKLVFDFIAEFLKDEKQVESKPVVEDVEKTTTINKDDNEKDVLEDKTKRILDIIKRVELNDKMRRTTIPVVPVTDRGEDDIAERDREIIARHTNETGGGLGHIKTVLDDAKVMNDLLNVSHPIIESDEKPWVLTDGESVNVNNKK